MHGVGVHAPHSRPLLLQQGQGRAECLLPSQELALRQKLHQQAPSQSCSWFEPLCFSWPPSATHFLSFDLIGGSRSL